jgi:hypothetical protein
VICGYFGTTVASERSKIGLGGEWKGREHYFTWQIDFRFIVLREHLTDKFFQSDNNSKG